MDKDFIINNSMPVGNHKSGIYFLIDGDEIVYVGQTIQGLTRTFSHCRDKIFNKYFFLDVELDRLLVEESIYINKFSPKYNKAIPTNFSSLNILKSICKRNNLPNHKTFLKQAVSELGLSGKTKDDISFIEITDIPIVLDYLEETA